jgi:hypothetical protein
MDYNMDWDDIAKHAEESLDKRVSSISAVLKSNKLQINKLVSVCEALEKHFKGNNLKKNTSPEHALTERRSEARLRSPGLKRPTDFKKKLKEEEDVKVKNSEVKAEDVAKEQILKKTESRISIKKNSEVPEAKKEEDVKHKKNSSARHEDVKKGKEEDAKHEDVKVKKTIPKPNEKTPKKVEDKEDKIKKDTRIEDKVKKEPKVTGELKKKETKIEDKTPKKTENALKKGEEISKKGDKENHEHPEETGNVEDIDHFDLSPKPVHYDQSLIQQKLSSLTVNPHPKSSENFSLSTGVQILLHSLNKLPSEKFYLLKNGPPSQFLWLFKVLFLFLNKDFTEETLPEVTKDFLSGGKGTRVLQDIGSFLINLSNELDFSEETLEKVEKEVIGVQIDVKRFGKKCEVSGVLSYFIKEILLFGAVNMEEGPDWRLKRRWEYKLSQLVN